jgi:hypothetical protein
MNTLCKRERRKRKYTKVAEEFWNGGKHEASKDKKQKCISTQRLGGSIEVEEKNSSMSEQPGNVPTRNVKKKAKKGKSTKKR